jgi:prepilin-type N-terminal cleavage/methylation domain-containing protein/prepilin-type processing-associated H-X9-DG protein
MKAKKGFTLIELLVVIAIIAILAGILFPVFAKARERARMTRSLSNIRQLAMAVQQYSNDYNDSFPGFMNLGTDTQPKYVHNCWDEQIEPFVKNSGVFSNGDTGIKSPSQTTRFDRTLTYCLNGALIGPWNNGNVTVWTSPSILSVSALSNPSGTILFAEVATNSTATQAMSAYASIQPGTNAPVRNPVPNSSNSTSQYQAALTQWIDISPKAWVENTNSGINDYKEDTWKADFGVARDLYSGGGVYAFCDGHTAFQKISKTTTSGQNVSPERNWSPTANAATIVYNQWYPG